MNATFLLTLGRVGLLVCAAPLFAFAASPEPHLDPGPMLGHVGDNHYGDSTDLHHQRRFSGEEINGRAKVKLLPAPAKVGRGR